MARLRLPPLLREPLVHFLLLGAALFLVYAWRSPDVPTEEPSRRVPFGEGDVRWLRETWTLQWQREPTLAEMRALVREYLREELLAREARELGLDKDDTYVRRRLAQKVEFLVKDTSRLVEPTDDELRTYFDAHAERFRGEPRVSFTQVYFTREHHVEAVATLARLEAGANPMEQGDVSLLEAEFRETTHQGVSAQFGPKFADAVLALEVGGWKGPIESGYGFHLVRVTGATAAKAREFAAVRGQVLELWREDKERDDSAKYFARLLQKYDLVVDESVKPLVDGLGRAEGTK